MRQDDRKAFDDALAAARRSAYPPGEYVEQESFMSAGEIVSLAVRAGVGRPGATVLDLCCGVAGPGRHLTATLGCTYRGVDACPEAVDLARERAVGLDCTFEVGEVPPLPDGRFDVVLLLETLLAFEDKPTLLREVCSALAPGGRFGCTLEEGAPLTATERRTMPDADTVWLTPLSEMLDLLAQAGLTVDWVADHSRQHQRTATALLDAFTAVRADLARHLGDRAVADLLAAHRLWVDWLATGRVRKFAIVAERCR